MTHRFRVSTVIAVLGLGSVVAAAETGATMGIQIPPALPPCATYSAIRPEDNWKESDAVNGPEHADTAWKKYENSRVRWTLP